MYCGHGTFGNQLLLSDGSEFRTTKLQDFFQGSECEGLVALPKIFIYDCCRGGDEGLKVEHKIGARSGETTTLTSNNVDDQFCWFACSNGYKSFERKDKKGQKTKDWGESSDGKETRGETKE